MGIGFCVVVAETDSDATLAILPATAGAPVIGHAVADPTKPVHGVAAT